MAYRAELTSAQDRDNDEVLALPFKGSHEFSWQDMAQPKQRKTDGGESIARGYKPEWIVEAGIWKEIIIQLGPR